MTASNPSDRRELIVVTGASSGIGAATARELARRGFHVLAGVRRGTDADALRATNLEPIMLDITNEAEIAALVKRIAGYGKTRLGSDFLICVHLISFLGGFLIVGRRPRKFIFWLR